MGAARVDQQAVEKDIYASTEFGAHFHVQVEEWKDEDEIAPFIAECAKKKKRLNTQGRKVQ